MNKSIYNAHIVEHQEAKDRAQKLANAVAGEDQVLRNKIESGYYE